MTIHRLLKTVYQEQIKGKQKKQDTSRNIELQYHQNIPVVDQEDIQRKVIEQAKNLIRILKRHYKKETKSQEEAQIQILIQEETQMKGIEQVEK